MNLAAITHESTIPFRQPLARNRILFKLEAAALDCRAVTLHYWKRSDPYPQSVQTAPMTVRYTDGLHAQWSADVTFAEELHYIKYYFVLQGNSGEQQYYCEQGFTEAPPTQGYFEILQIHESDVLAVPQWSKGIVYYQIFPERFAIGNPSKGLHDYEPWSAAPTRENFLGGDLQGIQNKLPYLQQLDVECLYLTPVFAADFNHKYATTDYYQVDADFGTNEDLIALVAKAHQHGIRVLLDGVFNHVGIHFAPFSDLMQNGEASAYRQWFYPKRYPMTVSADCYECVGDYPYMPRLRIAHPPVREYVANVLLHWLRVAGIDGWRLDVADELDVQSVRYLRERVKAEFPDALLLGETWGDASRMVNEGDQFDCTMNYLFRDAMVDFFAKGSIDAQALQCRLAHMLMKYPDAVNLSMYNCLGSHDTARFLTEAGGEKWRLRLAVACQMLLPGSPALYYGDELGMAGDNDPGCRGGMDWDAPDEDLLAWTRQLAALRKQQTALRQGTYRPLDTGSLPDVFGFERSHGSDKIIAVFNRGQDPYHTDFAEGVGAVTVPPRSVKIIPII